MQGPLCGAVAMRILTLAFAAAFALSFLTITAEPAKAVGLCADESGHNSNPDLYNNMGGPNSDCDGVFCYGYSGNGNWNTCVPPTIYCSTIAPCPPPPIVTASAVGPPTLCVGTVYNNAQGPSSGCDGPACTGYSNGDWKTCVLDCTTDGCPQPTTTLAASALTVCAAGNLYNNAQGPSSGCDGYLCTGYSNGEWGTCVLDCTVDGCPRIEDPCRSLMCQPPMDP